MKRFMLLVLASLTLAGVSEAQDRTRPGTLRRDAGNSRPDAVSTVDSDVTSDRMSVSISQTPEMWFYEQERSRYEDPQAAVRRKAEFRSSQRAQRIASSHWYGMSNSRPSANATPLCGTYAPTWVSSGFDPNRWTTARDTSTTTVIVR